MAARYRPQCETRVDFTDHVRRLNIANATNKVNFFFMNHTKTILRCWRNRQDARTLSETETERVARVLLTLQRGLTGNRTLAGTGYMDEDAALGAYLLYYYTVTHTQITFALRSFLPLTDLAKRNSLRILDVGSGPAPASMAALDVLSEMSDDLAHIELTCVDSSAKALTLAKKLFAADYPNVCVHTKCLSLERAAMREQTRYDLIIASHVINELWKEKSDRQERRLKFLTDFAEHLNEGGILLICEPALLETSRDTIRLALSLSEKNFTVLAPCPNSFVQKIRCPIFSATASANASCHAEAFTAFDPLVLKIAAKAGLTRQSVKMTFFALQKECTAHTKVNEGAAHYRVVSDAMLNKAGRIRYLLCDGKRRIPISAKSDDSTARKIGFFNLKRYDAVTVTNPEMRGDAQNPSFGIDEKTRLTVRPFAPHSQGSPVPLLQAKSRARREETNRGRRSITPKR